MNATLAWPSRLLIIYASQRQPEVHRVTKAGIELEIVGIDMSLPPNDLIQQARNAAGCLVANALRMMASA